jgi:hypothetical protein
VKDSIIPSLEALGLDTTGNKPDLVKRLIAALNLKPQRCNLDKYHEKKRGLDEKKGTGDEDSKGEEAGTDTKKRKPPPPPVEPEDVPKDEWVEYFSSDTNKPYYYNPATKETKWVKPVGKPPAPREPPPSAALVCANQPGAPRSGIPNVSGGSSSNGSFSGYSPNAQFSSMMRAIAQGGANITLNAPGAFAAGCIVNMGESARGGGAVRSSAADELCRSFDRGPPQPRWHAQY